MTLEGEVISGHREPIDPRCGIVGRRVTCQTVRSNQQQTQQATFKPLPWIIREVRVGFELRPLPPRAQ